MDNIEDIYPLSSLQEGILFHVLNEEHTGLYIEQISFSLDGELDADRFRGAWSAIVARHPALRTSIHWEGVDQPLQVVHQEIPLPWCALDWRRLSNEIQDHRFKRFMAEDRQSAFDLDSPLLRFVLVSTGANRWRFLWTFHHILADGWSASMVLREVFEVYDRDAASAVDKPRPYRDYIEFLLRQDFDGTEHYWRNALDGVLEPTRLPIGEIAPARSKSVTQTECVLSPDLTNAAKSFARERQMTLNVMLQGIWAILLHLYSGESNVLFGVTVSGRPPTLRGVENMVGLFINTLPLRVSLEAEDTCTDVMQSTGRAFSQLIEHENTPLVKVQGWSSILDGNPLFESILVFENYPSSDSPLSASVTVSDMEYVEQSNYPLAVLVLPESALRVIFVHDPSRFTPARIRRLGEHFKGLVRQIVEGPDCTITTLNLLGQEEQQQLLASTRTFPRHESDHQSWIHLFEAQVALKPDKPALVCGKTSYTYAETDRLSNKVAHALIEIGCGPDRRVAICLERCAEVPICMLAIHKAGGAYIPIDATYPPERIAVILADAAPSVILHAPGYDAGLGGTNVSLLAVDTAWSAFTSHPETAPNASPSPEDLAYIIYTSGSTGTPRGVKVTHKNLAYSTSARFQYYHDVPVSRFLMPSSFAFDSSVAGVFWTLSEGGCLYLPEEDYARDVDHLGALIEKQGITHLLCVPSLYNALIGLEKGPYPSLLAVIVAGEPCPPSLVAAHRKGMGTTRLYNEYGPSECTVWCTVHDCTEIAVDGTVPIGQGIPGTTVYVVDAHNRILPQGVPGELCIAGPGVGPGYLNHDELTDEKFVTSSWLHSHEVRVYKTGDRGRYREDWTLEFLGRTDDQITIRGFRVEPGEIEVILGQHEAVEEVVVTHAASIHLGSGDVYSDAPLSTSALVRELNAMDPALADVLLRESEVLTSDGGSTINIEAPTVGPAENRGEPVNSSNGDDGGLARTFSTSDFEVSVRLTNPEFIRPPRDAQREWLLGQVVREVKEDLTHLDESARRFVGGAPRGFDELDATEDPADIMEDWQVPLMRSMAAIVGETHGEILEIGFGRGVSASMVQKHVVRSHTIIESNDHCIETHFRPWETRHADRQTTLLRGMWQDRIDELGVYDGILFHAYPLDEEDFIKHVMNSVTFAAHFFPHAAAHLKPGGVFTYLTTEIDSLGRGHQRVLLEHFESVTIRKQPVRVPENTRDSWWADSMVVVKAVMPEEKR